MNICVVGAGMQGRIAARDLKAAGYEVTVFDNDKKSLQFVREKFGLKVKKVDVTDRQRFVTLIKRFDIVVGALPAALGFYTMKCAVAAGVDLVDLSYASEDPFLLDGKARNRKVKIVPDAGFAPGLSNILVGEAYREMKGIESLRILVGGIPQVPQPPFNYRITWSPADLVEEYTRPTRIVRNKKTVIVETLSGVEEFNQPPIGRLECFYTDGLRTLLRTMKGVRNMEEKTIRYPGHARLFKTIIECGFLSDQILPYKKRTVNLKEINLVYLWNVLKKGSEKDISILKIEIRKGGKKRKYVCIDYYDKKNSITSMARMTAYTGSIITQCIKTYPGYGVIPPEYLGMKKQLCCFIKAELKKRNITIKKY